MREEDEVDMALLRLLRPADVSPARAERLRQRCHGELHRRGTADAALEAGSVWRRMVGPALIGAWSTIYLIETLRRAAAIYGF